MVAGTGAAPLASAGGTLAASQHALRHGWGGTLASGTRRAFRRAVRLLCLRRPRAIVHLRETAGIERAAVIDLDVRQGNGTAQIFEQDPLVRLSLHGKNNFRSGSWRSRIDVELDDKTGDGEYLERLTGRVLPAHA